MGTMRTLIETATQAAGNTQQWHGDNKLIQAKPLPNRPPMAADGTLVLALPDEARARDMYAYALGYLPAGVVALCLDPTRAATEVHVMPGALVGQPLLGPKLAGYCTALCGGAA
jgi:hypothetical protein